MDFAPKDLYENIPVNIYPPQIVKEYLNNGFGFSIGPMDCYLENPSESKILCISADPNYGNLEFNSAEELAGLIINNLKLTSVLPPKEDFKPLEDKKDKNQLEFDF